MGRAFIFIPFAGWERPGFHPPSTEIGSLATEAVVPSAGKPGQTPNSEGPPSLPPESPPSCQRGL